LQQDSFRETRHDPHDGAPRSRHHPRWAITDGINISRDPNEFDPDNPPGQHRAGLDRVERVADVSRCVFPPDLGPAQNMGETSQRPPGAVTH
jgi:hypothetical protein